MALGVTRTELAERAGVDRGALRRFEDGSVVRDATAGAIERALTALEHEWGIDKQSGSDVESSQPEGAASGPIRLTLHDVYGVGEIIAEGGDPDEVAEAVSRLLRRLRDENQGDR